MSLWLFGLWALFGVLFVTRAVVRGKAASALNRQVALGPLEHPLRWFLNALGWWHRFVALALIAGVAYGCVVDPTTRLVVALTITLMVIVTMLWKRRHGRGGNAAA